MRFDPCVSIFKSMKSGLEDEKPYWNYEDIGVLSKRQRKHMVDGLNPQPV
jgi:hypothetical protein